MNFNLMEAKSIEVHSFRFRENFPIMRDVAKILSRQASRNNPRKLIDNSMRISLHETVAIISKRRSLLVPKCWLLEWTMREIDN